MHLFEKRPVFPWKGIIISAVVFLAVLALFSSMLGRTSATADREQAVLLETAIRNAAVTSYAIEGNYPATLAQIVDEYGVIIDEGRFLVRYDVFAPNVMPDISVVFKGESAK